MYPVYDPVCILLETPFSKWRKEDKEDFLHTEGPSFKPFLEMENQGKATVRKFRHQWYSEYKWLCGSFYLKRLFCLPCLAVGGKPSMWNKEGFNSFGHVNRGCTKHQALPDHINCASSFDNLKKKNINSIEEASMENSQLHIKIFNENVLLNKSFMQLLIRATIYLAKQQLPFQGNNESDGSSNSSNIKELVESYVSVSNIDIQEHYKKISPIISANTKTIQNELIDCISDYIDDHIDREINNTSFFSIQVDNSTDIFQKSQCSMVIKYVNGAGKLVERFLGFFDICIDPTADDFFDLVTKRIEEYNYRSKLVGQCFDGARMTSRHVNDLQSKIKIEASHAVFLHCAAHNFNSVLQLSCTNIPQCHIFFANVNSFPSFFHHSTKDDVIEISNPKTRKTQNSKIIHLINNEWDRLKQFLTEIRDDRMSDQSSTTQSVNFLNLLNNFEFALFTIIFSEIFKITDILFDTLQKHSLNIYICMAQIKKTQQLLNEKKNEGNFQQLFDLVSAKVPANCCERQKSSEEIFVKYKMIYYEILDTISQQIEIRFQDMDKITFVTLMDTTRFQEYAKHFPLDSLNYLEKCLPNIFPDISRLKNELTFIYNDNSYYKIQLEQMLKLLHANRDIFREAYRLLCLIVTIPTTSISVEHSCSCLKRIKTYLQNSEEEKGVTNLAKISIEKELLDELVTVETFYEDIINKFALLKNRKIDLIFKK